MYKAISVLAFAGIFILSACSSTQQATSENSETSTSENFRPQRPIPYPVIEPMQFMYGVQIGTRTLEGIPGENYFTNTADYKLNAKLVPADTMLFGEAKITYHNNAPDSLPVLVFELAQNLHKEGQPRKEAVEVTGGINISRIAFEGEELIEVTQFMPGYAVEGTNLIVIPPRAIQSDGSADIEIDWNFKIPQAGASGRMGYSRDNLFFLAYWFPHVSTYDDIEGWFGDNFTGNAEFYHDFGNYEISISAPENWVIMSTGKLENAQEVLADTVYQRYRKAMDSDEVVSVLSSADFGNATAPADDGTLTWNFTAENVRDVAFSATFESQWDALRTPVGDADGDGEEDYTLINAFWREDAPLWVDAAEYTAHAISFLSDFTGISYPWPHMTSVEGAEILNGGMEFPMLTVIGSYNQASTQAFYDVTAHEIAHMWIPMIVSSNERRHAWMDEGATTFHEANARWDKFPESKNRLNEFNQYLQIAGTPFEGEIMRWSDYHYPGPAYGIASYPKPASVLFALQGVLGEQIFMEAWRVFLDRWAYKHPTPYDLFNTFEDISGENLEWFWRSWYFETWVMEQAIADVQQSGNEAVITIIDNGRIPMPVDLTITLENGTKIKERIPVDDWLMGKTQTTLVIETFLPVQRVVIDEAGYYPDINRSNNTWSK